MSSFKSRLATHIDELHFQRYKLASSFHEHAQLERSSLGTPLLDSTHEHLSAIELADAAVDIARSDLDLARAAYLREPERR